MLREDYRNTEFCKKISKISRKKRSLLKKIKKEHPRTKIIYNSVSNFYRSEFYKIYNYKCAYCGASSETLGIDRLEIDHFIHEASFGTDKIEAGKINNLVTACYGCNRRKSDFLIENEARFNPDKRNFKKLFYRNKNYEIKIFYKYLEDQEVKSFYNNLKLGAKFRKLDFLLLRLQYLIDELGKIPEKINERNNLVNWYRKLQTKRNNINPLSNEI